MTKSILVIGGHGMLGRPVVRRMVSAGFRVRAMARSVDKARKLLPNSVEVVQGDLEDVESIRRAAESMDVVYMNLETPNPKAAFRQDVDGPKNVVHALENRRDVFLIKIAHHPLFDTKGWWPNADLKVQGEEIIRQSGHPYLFFHPTWFMESLNLLCKDHTATLFGRRWNPLHFIAGDDYGRMVVAALHKNVTNRTFVVQGLEAMDFQQAVERFAAEIDTVQEQKKRSLRIIHIPMCVTAMFANFVPLAKDMHRLFTMAQTQKEEFVSQTTWDELVKPEMKIEDYVHYRKETGDIPAK